jgi:hypothetical protein
VIKSKRIRWPEHVAHMGEKEINKKQRGTRPLGRTGVQWILKKLGCAAEDWTELANDRV